MSLEDENAFGLLIAYHDVEEAEYALERDQFVERFCEFRAVTLDHATTTPLGPGARVLDLGHALYFEIADGDQSADLVSWLRGLRSTLVERSFQVTAVLTHGGRWVTTPEPERLTVEALTGGYQLLSASRPSEPLRRALHAETATHGSAAEDGWGSGTYLDTEAVEALGRALKNAPTPLVSAGATFFRLGR